MNNKLPLILLAVLLSCGTETPPQEVDAGCCDTHEEVSEAMADLAPEGTFGVPPDGTGLDAPADGTEAPLDPAQMTFGSFSKWTNPIEDYIAINTEELGHGNFMKDIFDLAVFDDRLYIAYGDANLNLGRITPIEIRYFTDWTSKEYAFDFTTDEEQIDRYRHYGEALLIPGVDATEDAFLGNVYALAGTKEWVKSRTLAGAWHVHDVAVMGGTVYACGSGGTGEDYQHSTVHAFLYASQDQGENFDVLVDLEHPNPPGDQRHVHLLPNGGDLYVFGYYSDDSGVVYGTSYVLTDDTLVPFDGMPSFFMLDTLALTADVGLAVGVHIETPLRQGIMRVEAGIGLPIEALEEYTVVDLEPLGDGRALVLALEGNSYPLEDKGGWPAHVGVLSLDGSLQLVADFFPTVQPVSVAWWQGRLLVGMADGTLFRAAPLVD